MKTLMYPITLPLWVVAVLVFAWSMWVIEGLVRFFS